MLEPITAIPPTEIPQGYEPWFDTAKGSSYFRNPTEGTTIRYKSVESKIYPPQDVMVFVLDYETLTANEPRFATVVGENETQYQQYLLSFVQDPTKKAYIVDGKGNKIETERALQNADAAYLALGHINEVAGFVVDGLIPVAKVPKVNYQPFDTRKYRGADGILRRERHLGNKIVAIKS